MAPRDGSTRTTRAVLDRYELDRVARAVASGRRTLGPRLNGIADAMAAQMLSKLAAAGVPTPTGRRLRSHGDMGRDVRSLLVTRVAKHLATGAAARVARVDGRARRR